MQGSERDGKNNIMGPAFIAPGLTPAYCTRPVCVRVRVPYAVRVQQRTASQIIKRIILLFYTRHAGIVPNNTKQNIIIFVPGKKRKKRGRKKK